jgi:hypothetical protein
MSECKFEWFSAYIGACLAERYEGVPPVDDDGDWVINWVPGTIWVRAEMRPRWAAEVFAYAAHGVKPRAAALREVNDLNMRLCTASVYIAPSGTVTVRQRLVAAAVDGDTIGQAIASVGNVAEDVGMLMAGMFDGHAPASPVPPRPRTGGDRIASCRS